MKLTKPIIGILFLLICIVGVFYFLKENPSLVYYIKGERDLSLLLDNADIYIKNKNYKALKAYLIYASDYANVLFDWLSLLKRAKVIADNEGDYSIFLTIVDRGLRELKGNYTLRAFQVYALLRSRKINEAYEVAVKYLKDNLEYAPLYYEAYLEKLVSVESYSSFQDFFNSLYSKRDSQLFEQIGLNIKNIKFLLNAIIIHIENKNYEEAERILKLIGVNKDFARELSLLSYELGNLDLALANLKLLERDTQDEGLIFILAEIYFKNKDYESAKQNYLKLYTLNNKYNVYMYLNLSFISRLEKDYKRALFYLQKAAEYFENDILLEYHLANLFYEMRDFEKARELTVKNKNEPLFFNLYFDLNYKSKPYNVQKAILWQNFYSSEQYSSIAKLLLYSLLLREDIDDIELFFKFYNVKEGDDWYDFYKFYYLFLIKDFTNVKSYAKNIGDKPYNYGIYFNLAIFYFAYEDYNQARFYFNKSLEFLALDGLNLEEESLNFKKFISKIYFKMAINYIYLKELSEAKKAIENSIKFNLNYENSIYKNMIDSIYKR